MALNYEDAQRLAGKLMLRKTRQFLKDLDIDDLIEEETPFLQDEANDLGVDILTEDDLDVVFDFADSVQIEMEVFWKDAAND